MFPTEPLMLPVAPPPTAALSPSIATPSFLSQALYLLPHSQTISQSFPDSLESDHLSPLPWSLAPRDCSLPAGVLIPLSPPCTVSSQLSRQSGSFQILISPRKWPTGPSPSLRSHLSLCALFTSLKFHGSPCCSLYTPGILLSRMLSPWANAAVVLTEPLILSKVAGGHMLIHLTIT